MDVGSLNSQNSAAYQAPEPRSIEAPEEATAQVAAATAKPVHVSAEPVKKNGSDEANGAVVEKLDDRQIEDMLSKGISDANKKLSLASNELQYSYHKKTRTVSVKVINTDTKEVVREIPPQKALDALAKVWELAGILVDEKK